MILVSACLAGIKCAWDGHDRLNQDIKSMVERGEAIAVCPEVLGGRTVPRTKTEVCGGDGAEALLDKARVVDENSKDVTDEFLKGAYEALNIAKKHNIKKAILKARSPSCGVGKIYDGNFKSILIEGDGVTTALLKRESITCESL